MPRMPSCASLPTATAASNMHLFLPAEPGRPVSIAFSLPVMAQHRRALVGNVFLKELSIRRIIFRWCNPFPWHNAWESHPYACRAIEPARGRATCEPFAEVGGEVIAVLREEVIRSPLKCL